MSTLKEQQQGFDEITGIYDALDRVVDVLADKNTQNIGNQLPVAKEFVFQVGCAVDAIAETYCRVMKRGDGATAEDIHTIEVAAGKIISEMEAVLAAFNRLKVH